MTDTHNIVIVAVSSAEDSNAYQAGRAQGPPSRRAKIVNRLIAS